MSLRCVGLVRSRAVAVGVSARGRSDFNLKGWDRGLWNYTIKSITSDKSFYRLR